MTWGLYPALHRTLSVGIGHEGGIVQLGGRSSPASQPTASVFMGSMGTAILSVRSQVEHSNVRSSNPRVPGEIRASAILCLHTGHIGRSLIASPITLPQDHRQRTCCSLIMGHRGRSSPPPAARIAGSPWADLLLPARDRWRNPAVGPMDGRPGQAMVAN